MCGGKSVGLCLCECICCIVPLCAYTDVEVGGLGFIVFNLCEVLCGT